MEISVVISIVSIVASACVAWGIVKQQVKNLEERLSALEDDNKTNREILIEIRTKVQMILEGSIRKHK